jgi:hypothetical protein
MSLPRGQVGDGTSGDSACSIPVDAARSPNDAGEKDGPRRGIVANVVNHFEIHGTDGKRAQDFYGSLFGWSIDANNPMNYGMVSGEAGGIGGGIAKSMDGKPMVTIYVEVADLDATLAKVAGARREHRDAAGRRARRAEAGAIRRSRRQCDRAHPVRHDAGSVSDELQQHHDRHGDPQRLADFYTKLLVSPRGPTAVTRDGRSAPAV